MEQQTTVKVEKVEYVDHVETDYRFFSHFNRQAFVHVELCRQTGEEPFPMVKFWAGIRKDGAVEQSVLHFLSYEDLRYMIFVLMYGLENKGSWESYKGKKDAQGLVTSRPMNVRRDGEKYFLNIGQGPGIETKAGLFQPDRTAAPETWQYVSIMLTHEVLIKFCLRAQAILNALTVREVMMLNIWG